TDQQPLTLTELEREPADQPAERLVVVEVEAALAGEHAHGPVHGSGVDVREAETPGERPAGRRLPRAGRPVDRDDLGAHRRSTVAPSAASRSKKPGNETAAHAGSVISTPPSATSPATANAIAMRWSPPDVMRPPRSRRPPLPRTTRPSAVVRSPTPSGTSC